MTGWQSIHCSRPWSSSSGSCFASWIFWERWWLPLHLKKITFPLSRNQGKRMSKQREGEFKSSTNIYFKRLFNQTSFSGKWGLRINLWWISHPDIAVCWLSINKSVNWNFHGSVVSNVSYHIFYYRLGYPVTLLKAFFPLPATGKVYYGKLWN